MIEADEEEIERIARMVEAGEDEEIAIPIDMIRDLDIPAWPTASGETLWGAIQKMSVSQKVKLALRGNKDARTVLSREGNKVVRTMVLRNPRITDGEVLMMAQNRTIDEEVIRIITDRREWMQNYRIRHALATNPKTPIPVALRQVDTLAIRDLRLIAKSRNVHSTVAQRARRKVVEAEEGQH
jgi:hypothetical protein